MSDIVLARHGETGWSRAGRHTGRTDVPLTERGEANARALRGALAGRRFGLVLTSPLLRARSTAELAGLDDAQPDPDLVEWDYGGYEGVTTDDIQRDRPGWYLWDDGVPGGESLAQLGARADRVLARARAAGGDVMLVGHGHALRVLGARWVGLPPAAGGKLRLDTGTLSVLGAEHDRPVLLSWNATVSSFP